MSKYKEVELEKIGFPVEWCSFLSVDNPSDTNDKHKLLNGAKCDG